jgi:hypothetical protein
MNTDILFPNERSALAALCAKQPLSDHPDELAKYSFRLGNNHDLRILGNLEFNLDTSEKYALIMSKTDFSLMHPPHKVGDIDKCKFIVLERELRHDDIGILGKNNKNFNPLKLELYAAFVLLKIRNPVGMLSSMRVEFTGAGCRAFFIKQFK